MTKISSKKNLIKLIFIYFFVTAVSVYGQVKLPRLISDGMILQRDAKVKIWGWAAPNEKITLQFMDSTFFTIADNSGCWEVYLNGLKPGGPYKMKIQASNVIEVQNILIGDVWLCSGQSNMELPMRRVSWIYTDEISKSDNDHIRQFKVPQRYDFNKQHTDLNSGSWKTVNSDNIMDFSAVAYFFAKEIFAKYNVPVGLINASLGGSPIEAWMSEEALKKYPVHYNEMQRFKDSVLIAQIINSDNNRIAAWYHQLYQKDKGYKDKNHIWYQPDLGLSEWSRIQVPGYWSGTELEEIDGSVWYRRTFMINPKVAEKPATLILGRIIDSDSVFINGLFVGTTSYQYPPRRYKIPSGTLKTGENTIVVRVINNQGEGGFVPDKSYEIICGNVIIDLQGIWHYRIGAIMEPLASQTFIRWKPGGLYNSMISPLLNYHIKGVIWYQGESNAWRPLEYRELFPAMIRDWRNNWKQDELPFIFVQLPNYMEPKNMPSESNWALLRESQSKALSLPNTGMAVTIDIGEWNDIHPLNKRDVGYRLSLAAQKIAYSDKKTVYSGPVYSSMHIDSNKIILTFINTGSGLLFIKGKNTNQFAIAGIDRKFVWANAEICNDKIIVWNEEVINPVAVRYAWADNPENASLFNKEGLPASPFRTDDWLLNTD